MAERDTAVLYADRRLRVWADWARRDQRIGGLPSVTAMQEAMASARVGVVRGRVEDSYFDEKTREWRPSVTAKGSPTRQSKPPPTAHASEEIAEVDAAVARLPKRLNRVIMAEYFVYGPREVRAKAAHTSPARYSQLLESARYSVFAGLAFNGKPATRAQRGVTAPR